jgi:hypothetical protein
VRIEYDCATGGITGRIATDRDGRFDVRGTFVRERGGPQREGDEARAQPARYVGLVNGSSMTGQAPRALAIVAVEGRERPHGSERTRKRRRASRDRCCRRIVEYRWRPRAIRRPSAEVVSATTIASYEPYRRAIWPHQINCEIREEGVAQPYPYVDVFDGGRALAQSKGSRWW